MKKFAGIVESSTPPPIQYVWLYDGKCKYFTNGVWTDLCLLSESYIKKEHGEFKFDRFEIITLEEGSTDEIKKRNIDKLKVGKFYTYIHGLEGLGFGQWDDFSGGYIRLINEYGSMYYFITPQGAVIKHVESPDIYYQYRIKGGLKEPEEFIDKLIELIE